MAMKNAKSAKRLLENVQKQLGRDPSTAELSALLQGDNSVLVKNKDKQSE
jgi:hypothetical protein